MNTIGPRIKNLRKRIGMSQQVLADLLGVKRPIISQIENKERKISSEELRRFSEIFQVSADSLLDLEKEIQVVIKKGKEKRETSSKIRISVPQKNLKIFKEVLLYLLNEVGSKPNIGETVIYKLLYFIDFNFYEKYEEQLIGATYIKDKYGPRPMEIKKVVDRMVKDEQIKITSTGYYGHRQVKYLPLRKADLTQLRAHEIKIIDDVLKRLSDMNASQIGDYSHNDVPWLTTEDKAEIEYESVFYRTPRYSVREYSEDL